MEFILELIFDIILEGSLKIGTSRKVPVGCRIVAVAVLAFVYIGLVVLLITFAVDLWKEGRNAAAVIVGIIDIFVSVLIICVVRKNIKNTKNKYVGGAE